MRARKYVVMRARKYVIIMHESEEICYQKSVPLQPDFGCNSDWLISSKSIFDWLKLIT